MINSSNPLVSALTLLASLICSIAANADSKYAGAANSNMAVNPPTIYLVQLTHTDIAWHFSPYEDAKDDVAIINYALDNMKVDPDFKYQWEDMVGFDEYLSLCPERTQEMIDRVNQGKLLFGSTYSQSFESVLSSETLMRQIYFGRKWFKDEFPSENTETAYDFDTPQRALQMNQILKKSGVNCLGMSRTHDIFPGLPNTGLFDWTSPDGSSVFYWTMPHYGIYHQPDLSVNWLKKYVDDWQPYYKAHRLSPNYILLVGEDYRNPELYPKEMEEWNSWAASSGYPRIEYATLQEALKAIKFGGGDFDKASGERPNMWIYEIAMGNSKSTSLHRDAAAILPEAEAFWTFRAAEEGSFAHYPTQRLKETWRKLAWADHSIEWDGSIQAFIDVYSEAKDSARQLLNESTTWIAKHVNTRSQGTPIIVFNGLSWKRTGPVECDIPTSAPSSFALEDSTGANLDYQKAPGGKIVFTAADAPSFGYKTYYLVKSSTKSMTVMDPAYNAKTAHPVATDLEPAAKQIAGAPWTTPYENAYYKITPANGCLSSIYDKILGKELFDTSKFKIGELVDLSSPGPGASGQNNINLPQTTGYDRISSYPLEWRCSEAGSICNVYETTRKMEHYTYSLKLTVYNNIKRIDFEPSIVDWDGAYNREFRMMFPVNSSSKDVVYDVPFAVSRVGEDEVDPAGIGWGKKHQPREVQNFIYAGGNGFGVTIGTSAAAFDYMDPTDNPQNIDILQPMLFATRTEDGAGQQWTQKGTHSYKFSLYSHDAGYQNGYRSGFESNTPLIAVTPGKKDKNAKLPEIKSFCEVSPSNIIVSAVKKSEDDNKSAIIRLYEVEGKDNNKVKITFPSEITAAYHTNLIEEDPTPLHSAGETASLTINHRAIEAVKLNFKCENSLSAPTDLECEYLYGGKIRLSWKDNSQSEAGFRIEYRTADHDYSILAKVDKTARSYETDQLKAGEMYRFRVCAFKLGLPDSLFSNENKALAVGPEDRVWIDDKLPRGYKLAIVDDAWQWTSSNPASFSGLICHKSNPFDGVHQHYFEGTFDKLIVDPGDTLVCYIYLDKTNPPKEVMLQWQVYGEWEHRAFWGADLIGWGAPDSDGRRRIGDLPKAGQWARLEVPASRVGLEGKTVIGMAFSLYGGAASWDWCAKIAEKK